MSELRHKLVKENEGINWEPAHIKEGRFGEWLREVKDWAISRERYWGTPLPIWLCAKCGTRKVIGSVDEIKGAPRNTFYVMRHGEAENNVKSIVSSVAETPHHLTELGKEQARMGAQWLKDKKIDLIFVSPFVRTRETAAIVAQTIGLDPKNVIVEPRIHELNAGVWNGKSFYDLIHFIGTLSIDARFQKPLEGGEDYADVKKRMGDTLYDIEKRYEGKNILFVTHDLPACLLVAAAEGLDHKGVVELRGTRDHFLKNAEVKELDFHPIPHNTDYELDLHRPYIDEVKLVCTCGGEMKRVKEVMDVWFDSGAMPFAQNHYPFEKREERSGKKEGFLARIFGGDRQVLSYPADFISEAIDQTRGWFYTLHAVGILMGKGKAYKNVISLGHILDAQGKKMSKSIGNVVDPWMLMDKYGADALRFWMYSVNSPGDSKNFDEKTVDEIIKKVFNLTSNVASFYKMYAGEGEGSKEKEVGRDSHDVLDRWIVARLDQLVDTITSGMEGYVLLEPTRAIRDFVADLSQWYLRRSRDRFKGGDSGAEIMDKQAALATTRYVLLTLAKVMAPFTPFFAEELYQDIGGDKESVHLEEWPTAGTPDTKLVADMDLTRKVASKGLEARMAAKINVRQPLSKLSVNNSFTSGLSPECAALIKDEVNVKEVTFGSSLGKDVELDLTITPALKAEGDLRELIRSVQDLRKEKGLKVGDKASLIVPMESKVLVDAYTDDIKKAASLVSIEIGDTLKLKD